MKTSIAIPTYQRGEVLIDTVRMLLEQTPPAAEIILSDQTARHSPTVARQLQRWNDDGVVRWLRLFEPSIPRAMNRALMEARFPVVLFLDDDIVPADGLVGAHARNYLDESICAVTGQILQPGQEASRKRVESRGKGIWRDLDFPFNGSGRCEVHNCMAGNLSVRRDRAIAAGGFDENFEGVSYRFETEFCRRLIRLGGRVVFDSSASIRHLQAARGGTRVHGMHLASASPAHSVGDYYFAFCEREGAATAAYAIRRLASSIGTRFHFRHPWIAPVKLLGEIRGLCRASKLFRKGPRIVRRDSLRDR